MRRDPHTAAWDALKAARKIQRFTQGIERSAYFEDDLLQSAVERQFEVIGESLNRMSRLSSELATQIPDLPKIVAFRNVLIHGYAEVETAVVWDAVTTHLPPLIENLSALLGEAPAQSDERP
ncbi:HepT-like ribonuclease domain-containing protein [Brachybacterium sp. Marseille-Q7125]|uniref:HepT-like ribonuclease domain-containing protein n=1 Tax=Brachybacterium sp. Marseille-Q7125 TaxID=2932815 RepID=UPI001FF6760E|nr:HepT-like ribonuclease domain-containing protein [Brachybacterium sp. Marseille-Q7125]